MKYFVRAGEQEHEVEVRRSDSGPHVTVDGKHVAASLSAIRDGEHVLELDGQRHALWIELAGAEFAATPASEVRIDQGGFSADVEVLSELQKKVLSQEKAAGVSHGPRVVKAPMPCKVSRVLVKVGDTVVAGQVLIVIEAMKMESEVKATGPGVVRDLRAEPGHIAEAGTTLVVLGDAQ